MKCTDLAMFMALNKYSIIIDSILVMDLNDLTQVPSFQK